MIGMAMECVYCEDELLHYTMIVPELKQTGTSDRKFEKNSETWRRSFKFARSDSVNHVFPQSISTLPIITIYPNISQSSES